MNQTQQLGQHLIRGRRHLAVRATAGRVRRRRRPPSSTAATARRELPGSRSTEGVHQQLNLLECLVVDTKAARHVSASAVSTRCRAASRSTPCDSSRANRSIRSSTFRAQAAACSAEYSGSRLSRLANNSAATRARSSSGSDKPSLNTVAASVPTAESYPSRRATDAEFEFHIAQFKHVTPVGELAAGDTDAGLEGQSCPRTCKWIRWPGACL